TFLVKDEVTTTSNEEEELICYELSNYYGRVIKSGWLPEFEIKNYFTGSNQFR
ncbi:6285_t:CDS:2, partial [Dentiscutata erythropus]